MINESIIILRFEWLIALMIVVLFVLNLMGVDKNPKRFMNIVNAMLVINFVAGFIPLKDGYLFQGFYHTTALIVLEKNILNLGLMLIAFSAKQWIIASKRPAEFFILMFSSVLGMYVMLSSGHILVLYLGLELSSLPLAALAAFNTDSRKSSEAGVKYILSSAFSTGITLFGISLLYGAVGNLGFDAIIQHIHEDALTLTAFVFILAGFSFKMSIVPFHMWTADVFEGAPTPVTNYLAVVSKGSVIFIFITVLYTVFGKLENAWLLAISILSVLSMTVGNIFALRQQNIKRFLAFSSIAQVGFVLVGIAGASNMGTDSVVYFLVIYLLSNIALFSIVEAISDETGKETISDYKGLYKSNPFYAIIFTVALFSLAGVPPTAGFFGKLFLLTSGMGSGMYVLLGFATINLVLSLYTYLRVVKAMFIDPEEERMPLIKKSVLTNFVLAVCLIGIIILGFAGVFYQYIDSISSQL